MAYTCPRCNHKAKKIGKDMHHSAGGHHPRIYECQNPDCGYRWRGKW